MDYETVAGLFLQAPADAPPVPGPVERGAAARRLRDAIEPIATHGWWSRRTNERLTELGLNFWTGYVYGRAAPLGDVPASVVVAAFAVFEPGLIVEAYEEAHALADRADVLRVREEATIESLRAILAGADVQPVAEALRKAVEAAEPAGRPLFSGLRALGWPKDPLGRLWRACEALREHRGDGHVAVCLAAGLDAVEMNVLTELWLGGQLGVYTVTRGWGFDAVEAAAGRLEGRGLLANGALTEQGRAFREDIEARTDEAERSVIDAIGDGFEDLIDRLEGYSRAVIDAGAFPPDPFKRAAG